MRGQTGPERHYTGFGNQGAALAGLVAITGWPDRAPAGPWGAYTDFITPRYGVAALTAALLHRDATGRGQYIDLSQIEAGIQFHAPLLLDHAVNGRIAQARPATRRTTPVRTAPTGRAASNATWQSACRTASQWDGALRSGAVPASLRSLTDLQERIDRRDAIEIELARWCADHDAFELTERLQRAGVPSHPVSRPTDLFEDAQLQHRGFFVTLDHPVMGPTPYDGPVTRFSRTPAQLRSPGRCSASTATRFASG